MLGRARRPRGLASSARIAARSRVPSSSVISIARRRLLHPHPHVGERDHVGAAAPPASAPAARRVGRSPGSRRRAQRPGVRHQPLAPEAVQQRRAELQRARRRAAPAASSKETARGRWRSSTRERVRESARPRTARRSGGRPSAAAAPARATARCVDRRAPAWQTMLWRKWRAISRSLRFSNAIRSPSASSQTCGSTPVGEHLRAQAVEVRLADVAEPVRGRVAGELREPHGASSARSGRRGRAGSSARRPGSAPRAPSSAP